MLLLKGVSHFFGSEQVLQNISFELKKGEILGVIGESGSGKSTLLRLIYGEYPIKHGEMYWKNRPWRGLADKLVPGGENMYLLSQNFDLQSFSTVAENVGKPISNQNQIAKEKRVKHLLKKVGLFHKKNAKVEELSGGQQQRVALARGLASSPELLLMDEPFSHVDEFLRFRLRYQLFTYIRKEQITTIISSHDIQDILPFCDKVMVLKKGKMVQIGSTERIYHNPKNNYVASLFGGFFLSSHKKYVYPYHFELSEKGEISGSVLDCLFCGHSYLIVVMNGKQLLNFYHETPLKQGEEVRLAIR